jgi:hypothetical protein
MKQLKVITTATLAGAILLAFALSNGEAQARSGQGQRLRDGSCVGRAVTQGTAPGQTNIQTRGYGRLTGTCTGLGPGSGRGLGPQGGMGYRYGAR